MINLNFRVKKLQDNESHLLATRCAKLNSAHYVEVWRDFGRENGFVYRHIAPLVLQGDDDIVVKLVFVGYAFDFVAYDSDGVGDFLVFCFVFV